MLTLILQTQEGQKIELNVQPEDTFVDLKSQYAVNDNLSDPLEQLITNGASVPGNTKIFDYITNSAHEWFDADQQLDIDDATQPVMEETERKKCCARGCLNSESLSLDKQFFPLPKDHERLSICLAEAGRQDLYNEILESESEACQKYFLCSSHYVQEVSFLPCSSTEQSSVSLLKPKNERMWADTKGQANPQEKDNEFQVDSDCKPTVLELLDGVGDLEHPGILCRLCGEPTVNPIHLYARDEASEEFSLADKINLCLPVTVTVTDPLPKQICEECQSKLNTCHELALASLRTEDKLGVLLRERKLCVEGTEQCPLCLDGNVRIVEKSGVYRKDELEKNLCCSSNSYKKYKTPTTTTKEIYSMETYEDESLTETKPLLEDLNLDSQSKNSSLNHQAKNSPSTSLSEELPAPDSSVKINDPPITNVREDRHSEDYSCIIYESPNFGYSQEIENQGPTLPEGNFTCTLCRYECAELEEAAEHAKNCTPELWEIRCDSCNETFFNTEQANEHRCPRPQESQDKYSETATRVPKKRKKQPLQYNCYFCQKYFSRKESLKCHISEVHKEWMDSSPGSKCYKCRICNEAFAREAEADMHASLRHHSGPFSASEFPAGQEFVPEELTVSRLFMCEFCERCFTTPSSLHEHRESEHDKSQEYSCRECERVFDLHRQLVNHKSTQAHHGAPKIEGVRLFYVCKYCDKTFIHYSSLSSHTVQHQDALPYLCRPCNAHFETYRDVAVHRDIAHPYQSSVHETPKRSYKCQYCQKQFSYEVVLVKHIRIHTGEKPYKCSVCGKGFAQSSGLNTHLKIHSDLRPYLCPKCPRTFKIKGDCDNHMKRHSGVRPYKCEFCSKAFMTQHVYSQHRRIHTNDRPYKCDVCGEAFRRSHVLTVHRRIHTGEKPHVCDLCPKSYRQRGDLLKHKKVQHGVGAAAKISVEDNYSDNSFECFVKSNSKMSSGKGNSSLLVPL